MLSQEEKKEIDEELAHSPTTQFASIESLKIVQKHRGWVSDEALQDLADYLKLPIANLESVATFYNLIYRRPVGRHVIHICDSISCYIVGYDQVVERLKSTLGIELGQTTDDERFTLLPIPCLGTCDHAPALIIDEDTYGDLKPDDIGGILEKYK